jgi:hypothetical protein
MAAELRVRLFEEGVDEEALASLTTHLRSDLLRLDVEDVRALRVGAPPAGARSFDAVAVGTLPFTLGQSTEALRSVTAAILGWLARNKSARKVRLEIDGATLELSEATADDQERLVQLFVDRHTQLGGQS